MVARLSIYPQGAPFLYTVESGLENECVLSIHVLTVVLIVYTVYLLYLFIYLLFFSARSGFTGWLIGLLFISSKR